MQLTRATIEKWAGAEVFEEAEERVRRGAVMKAEVNGDVITGLFARTGASPVKCEFTVNADGTVTSRCPCEKHERYGLICIHVVALAISVMQRMADPARQRRYEEEQRHARRIQDALEASFRRIPHGGVAARLLIELPRDFARKFFAGSVPIRLVAMVGDPEEPYLLEKIPRDKPLTFPEEDDTVLDVLEDIAETGLKSSLELSRIDFLGLLDVSRGRTLFLSGGGSIEVMSSPAKLTVKAGLDTKTGEMNLKPYVDCGAAGEIAGGEEGDEEEGEEEREGGEEGEAESGEGDEGDESGAEDGA
ncbi:MAG: SWIM zinc finger family protein, partial [Kiritimatiellae bacterium]|nr:SWIM zinc finger family protein [Kiritimatiellia bacterium]